MHRKALLDLLADYGMRFPEEMAACERLIDFVRSHEQCFSRQLEIGHVTGSAWILDTNGERVLLTHHRKLDIWVQPGGHADGDHDILRVARREATEETGLPQLQLACEGLFDIDIHAIPARGTAPAHDHYDCRFAFQVNGSEAYVVSDESHDLQWIPLHQVIEYNNEASLQRMITKTADLKGR